MGRNSFSATTGARTRCAKHILETPELLALYEEAGGLPVDLTEMVEHGELAEAFNLTQSQTASVTKVATTEIATRFLALKRENAAVTGVLLAVVLDLERDGGPVDLVPKLEGILANEAQLQFSTVEVDGVKQRKTTRSMGKEQLRIEIEKDASALVALTAAHPLLARRRVDLARLEALRDLARSLAGKLADRAVKRGAKVTATQQEREAVDRQSRTWAACYRILALVGSRDPRIQELLREASRSR